MAQLILVLVILFESLPSLGALGHQPLELGMSQDAVERRLGPPPFGYELWGDRTKGVSTAHYRTGRVEAVYYRGGKVDRIELRQQRGAEWTAPMGDVVIPPVPLNKRT